VKRLKIKGRKKGFTRYIPAIMGKITVPYKRNIEFFSCLIKLQRKEVGDFTLYEKNAILGTRSGFSVYAYPVFSKIVSKNSIYPGIL
jgi:hypothetical protein